jgi:hypothetical protein
MRSRTVACLLLLPAVLAAPRGPLQAQPASPPPPLSTITFAPGAAVTTVTGKVVLGGSELYAVQVRAGQTLLVSVTAQAEVTFQVFAPDATLGRRADGQPEVTGTTLPNAGPHDDAKAWVGAIGRTGRYLIAVSMGEQGPVLADFALTVSVQ